MTVTSIALLLAQADATLPDNVTQDISPADVRNLVKDFLDTMSPAYGAITLASVVETLSAVPQVIAPFLTAVQATAGYFVNNLTNGTTQRLLNAPGTTDFIIASGAVSGPNNNNVTVELFVNGVASGFRASVTCTGAGDNVGFNIAGLRYDTVAKTYDLRATAPAGSYTFTNVSLIAQAQPVRDF